MTLPTYNGHRGWVGWGQPASLTKEQASEHSRLLKIEGKCGAVCKTSNLGFGVCDRYDDGDEHRHVDGRLAVVWSDDDYTGGIGPDGYPAITWRRATRDRDPIWVTIDGERIAMRDMTDGHLANALAFVVRKRGPSHPAAVDLASEISKRKREKSLSLKIKNTLR